MKANVNTYNVTKILKDNENYNFISHAKNSYWVFTVTNDFKTCNYLAKGYVFMADRV